MSSAATALAQEGMVFSIEPGIYLPGEMGRAGWRTWCWVTKEGCEVLNQVDKHWQVIG